MTFNFKEEQKKTTEREIQSIINREIFMSINKPTDMTDKEIINTKLIFNIKQDEKKETIDKFKSQLIATGFKQSYKINYKETFISILIFNALQIILAVACKNSQKI